MFAYDLEKLTHPKKLPPWGTFFLQSRITRNPRLEGADLEARVLKLVTGLDNYKGYFELDCYISKPDPLAVPLLDLENIELTQSSTPLIQRLEEFSKHKFTIGIFGILTGPRCMDEFLRLATANPTINFACIGKVRKKTLSPESIDLLNKETAENLFIHPIFIDDERVLNSAINTVDAVFIDGRNYPQHSGIVSKAISFSKCIISPEANAFVCDLIKEENTGFTYKPPSSDLLSHLNEWNEIYGPNKSAAAAQELRNPAKVSNCFKQMARQLKSHPDNSN